LVAVSRGVLSQRPHGHPGQALVEFALVAPILAMLLLGATDLTRAFYTYIVLSNASREAARQIVDYPNQYSDSAACTAGHNEALPFYNISCASGITISPAANTGVTPPLRLPGRNTVTVTAQTTFKPITVLIQLFMGSSITIKASTTYITWY
jgi:Flp pilus assembly protein TadG